MSQIASSNFKFLSQSNESHNIKLPFFQISLSLIFFLIDTLQTLQHTFSILWICHLYVYFIALKYKLFLPHFVYETFEKAINTRLNSWHTTSNSRFCLWLFWPLFWPSLKWTKACALEWVEYSALGIKSTTSGKEDQIHQGPCWTLAWSNLKSRIFQK